jgi:hypothetical protein
VSFLPTPQTPLHLRREAVRLMTRDHLAYFSGINSNVFFQLLLVIESLPASFAVYCHLVRPVQMFPTYDQQVTVKRGRLQYFTRAMLAQYDSAQAW